MGGPVEYRHAARRGLDAAQKQMPAPRPFVILSQTKDLLGQMLRALGNSSSRSRAGSECPRRRGSLTIDRRVGRQLARDGCVLQLHIGGQPVAAVWQQRLALDQWRQIAACSGGDAVAVLADVTLRQLLLVIGHPGQRR